MNPAGSLGERRRIASTMRPGVEGVAVSEGDARALLERWIRTNELGLLGLEVALDGHAGMQFCVLGDATWQAFENGTMPRPAVAGPTR